MFPGDDWCTEGKTEKIPGVLKTERLSKFWEIFLMFTRERGKVNSLLYSKTFCAVPENTVNFI